MTTKDRRQALEAYEIVYNEFSDACDAILQFIEATRAKYGNGKRSPYCLENGVNTDEWHEYHKLQLARIKAENEAFEAALRLHLWET